MFFVRGKLGLKCLRGKRSTQKYSTRLFSFLFIRLHHPVKQIHPRLAASSSTSFFPFCLLRRIFRSLCRHQPAAKWFLRLSLCHWMRLCILGAIVFDYVQPCVPRRPRDPSCPRIPHPCKRILISVRHCYPLIPCPRLRYGIRAKN